MQSSECVGADVGKLVVGYLVIAVGVKLVYVMFISISVRCVGDLKGIIIIA